MGASICWATAETDTQFTIFDSSALKKQCLIFFIFFYLSLRWPNIHPLSLSAIMVPFLSMKAKSIKKLKNRRSKVQINIPLGIPGKWCVHYYISYNNG